eukprot:273883-Hanusia_phi.AAC.1
MSWPRAWVSSAVTAFVSRPFRASLAMASPLSWSVSFSFRRPSLQQKVLHPSGFLRAHLVAGLSRGSSKAAGSVSWSEHLVLRGARSLSTSAKPRVGSTLKEFVSSHRDELINIGLASFLLILTIKLVRIKGESEDEAERLNKLIEDLQARLDGTKKKLEDLAKDETTAIASSISLKKGKEQILQEKILQIIEKGFDSSDIPKSPFEEKQQQPKPVSVTEAPAPTPTVRPKMI